MTMYRTEPRGGPMAVGSPPSSSRFSVPSGPNFGVGGFVCRTGSEPHSPLGSMVIASTLKPGQVVQISSTEVCATQWTGGAYFSTSNFIYVGSPDMWLLSQSKIGYGSGGMYTRLADVDTPLDTYRPPAPTDVEWPTFLPYGTRSLELTVENRSTEMGRFVVRLAGKFVPEPWLGER